MLDNNTLSVACLLLLVLLYIKCNDRKEFFETKPNSHDADKMSDIMLLNKDKFRKMTLAKKIMPWLDAITYEDSRRLIREGNFTKRNILTILG